MVRLLTDWTQRVRSGRHRSRRRIAFTLIMPWTGDRHLSLIVTMWEFPLMNCQYRENWNFSLLNKPKLAFTRMKTCNCWIVRHRLHGRQLVFWFFFVHVSFLWLQNFLCLTFNGEARRKTKNWQSWWGRRPRGDYAIAYWMELKYVYKYNTLSLQNTRRREDGNVSSSNCWHKLVTFLLHHRALTVNI